MKNILLACVNFNNYGLLHNYLRSIKASIEEHLDNNLKITLLVIDNSKNKEEFKPIDENNIISLIHHSPTENLGYIGGITDAIKSQNIKLSDYDYFIISNVDLELSKSFFPRLLGLEVDKDIGWIAPRIFSLKENKDRNPKILKRPSLKKMRLLTLMYRLPLFYYMYHKLIYQKTKRNINNSLRKLIYAGHGSFMIFTNKFLEQNSTFNFPTFLFGEEIYFAELCRISNLKVEYKPEIEIVDIDHSSTSKLNRKKFYKMNYESMNSITNLYFINE